jgi:transcriptional regulator with XRE-family HTH domain
MDTIVLAVGERADSRGGRVAMSLGEFVRDARRRKGWTQDQLGEAAEIDQGTVSAIETGRSKRPTYEVMQRLAGALEVSLNSLLEAAGWIEPEVAQNGHSDGFDRYEGDFVGWLRAQPRMRDELEEVRKSRGETVYRNYLRALWSAWEANFRATMAALRLGEGGDVT